MPSCSWFRTNRAGRFIILSAVMRFPPLFYFSSVSFFCNICNLIIFSVMFSTILEEADEETASRMVPVILERVGLLYHVKNYRKEIHEWVFFVLWAISNIVRQYSEIFFCIKPCNFLGKRVPPHPITCKTEKNCVFSLLFSGALGSWHVIFSFVMIGLWTNFGCVLRHQSKIDLYWKYLHSLCQITECFCSALKQCDVTQERVKRDELNRVTRLSYPLVKAVH